MAKSLFWAQRRARKLENKVFALSLRRSILHVKNASRIFFIKTTAENDYKTNSRQYKQYLSELEKVEKVGVRAAKELRRLQKVLQETRIDHLGLSHRF